MVIDTLQDLEALFEYIGAADHVLVIPILTDPDKHPAVNKISCIYVYTSDDIERIVPIHHTEQIRGFSEHLSRFLNLNNIFIHDKKTWLNLNGNDDVYDLKTLWWNTYNEEYDDSHYYTNTHYFFWRRIKMPDCNVLVPLMQHLSMCQKIRKYAWPMILNVELNESYKTFNNLYPSVFFKIESNGLAVNKLFKDQSLVTNSLVYSKYNYHTTTGRPSNAFRGFNFAAMNKNDGTRDAFCSRFTGGQLVEMDFDGYHIRLIARLLGYELKKENVHKHFAKYYFGTSDITDEQYEQSKKITFRLLYGIIDKEFLEIPFFKKVDSFIWDLWNQWKKKKYIVTAIDKRVISADSLKNMSANKLFNYYLQSLETEVSVRKLNQVLNYLETTDKLSKIILYTYDSILIDHHPEDPLDTIQTIQQILEKGNFPVKIKTASNYNQLK